MFLHGQHGEYYVGPLLLEKDADTETECVVKVRVSEMKDDTVEVLLQPSPHAAAGTPHINEICDVSLSLGLHTIDRYRHLQL